VVENWGSLKVVGLDVVEWIGIRGFGEGDAVISSNANWWILEDIRKLHCQ